VQSIPPLEGVSVRLQVTNWQSAAVRLRISEALKIDGRAIVDAVVAADERLAAQVGSRFRQASLAFQSLGFPSTGPSESDFRQPTLLINVLSAPTTTNIAVSNGRALSGVAAEHVFGPRVQDPRPLLGEIVTLIDGGDTPELRRLMGEELIELRWPWLVRLDGAAIDHRHCGLSSHSSLTSRTTQGHCGEKERAIRRLPRAALDPRSTT
jgi:hypothetical protein